jgi:ABC-type uncharacterized transport system involved in gliding motility auxiliary subunit
MEHATDWTNVGWAVGWFIAVAVLFTLGLRLPLAPRGDAWRRRAWSAVAVLAGLAVAVLAVAALSLHDTHVDLTREKAYTPSPQALAVVDSLRTPVHITYFHQGQDPNAQRARSMLALMADRNPLLRVTVIDPDKQPSLAETAGVRIYNAALIEAADRRLVVQSTDETEFAIGIQRVLRERRVTLCFIEGHNEYDVANEEYHTHLDAAVGHSHDDAAALVIETKGHGVGRWRRSLEGIGYDIERLPLPTLQAIPAHCSVVVDAGPRTTWLPTESAALRRYLEQGGAALLLHDLGYALEPGLADLLQALGATPRQAVVVDPVSHYGTDAEMVAVTGYDPHAITSKVAYSFFPGVRPLAQTTPARGITATPVVKSSATSTVKPVAALEQRAVMPAPAVETAETPGEQVLALASEGRLADGAAPLRAVIVGDADFLSNSFYPYMSNSDLALSMVRWLAREDQLTPIAQRVPVPPLVLLTEPQLRKLYLGVVGLLPLLAIVAGLVVWWRRR